jgi:RNA polymerase sigma factor (sigma-70 family)
MSVGQAQFVARHVHDLVERQRLDELSDQTLLNQFLATRDEAAFSALLRRHGPMVLCTCRRVLRHNEDAEDASQAAFLVLARKGGSVRGRQCLSGWLYRVAVRAALRLRREKARLSVEPLVDETQSRPVGDDLTWREVRNLFDREVLRLPERFRLPLILCCLQGKTRNEAARLLDWSEGAVRGRLERGRKLLRSRFARKGITLPAVALPIVLEQTLTATTPLPAVASSIVAAKLADGVLRSMAFAKVKLVAWAVSACLLLGSFVGLGMHQSATAQPKPGETPPHEALAAPLVEAEKNLDTFVLRVSLAPQGEGKFDPKFSLYHVLLYVPNLRVEPPANGPDGKPTEAHARITKEQAKKIVAALKDNGFFGEQDVGVGPRALREKSNPHAAIGVRYQAGEDPTQREIVYPWNAAMLKPLDAIRASVEGYAAKAMDQLLAQLSDDRQKWESSIDSDLKQLQGNWGIDPNDSNLKGLPSPYMCKCGIDGKNITFKPMVQITPLLDLDTIKGTFELKRERDLRTMTIVGKRDTISTNVSGTWTLYYRVTDSTLTLLLPAAGKPLPADGKPRWENGDREFVFKRVAAGTTSEWGQESNGVSSRIRSAKLKYVSGETPAFDFDVRDTTPGISGKPWHWLAPQVGQFARVEVDGVWYTVPETILRVKVAMRVVQHELKLGQTVEQWMTVSLVDDYWTSDDDSKTRLVLKTGKHKIRVGCEFTPSEAGKTQADPISGLLEFEVLPPEPASGVSSNWGEESNGVSSRIRTAKQKYTGGEARNFDLDLRDASRIAGKDWHWQGVRVGHLAEIEVDGKWYRAPAVDFTSAVAGKLALGETIQGWATVPVEDDFWEEPGGRKLTLSQGKHKIRVRYHLASSDAGQPGADPISGTLEIEIVATPVAKPAFVWKESSLPNSHGKSVPSVLTFSPDGKLLASVGGGELVVIDMTGKSPKEKLRRKLDGGLEFRGFDSKGEMLLLRRWPVEKFGKKTVSLTVLRGDEIDRYNVAAIAVDSDAVDYVAISPDLTRLGIATHMWDSVRIIDRATEKEQRMEGPKSATKSYAIPMGLAFSPDGKTLFGFGSNDYPVTGKVNGVMVAWDADTGAIRWLVEEEDGQRTTALSGDGKTLATAGRLSSEVVVRDAATGRKLRDFPANASFAVGLSPDGKTVVVGTHEDHTNPRKAFLEVFDVEGETKLVSAPAAGSIERIAFHPNGQVFVTAEAAGNLKWWERTPR